MEKEKRDEFEAVVKPVIKWLNDKANPMTKIIVDIDSAELVESVNYTYTTEFLKD